MKNIEKYENKINQSIWTVKQDKSIGRKMKMERKHTVVKDTDRVRAQLRIPLVGHVAPNVDQVHVLEIFLKKVPEK